MTKRQLSAYCDAEFEHIDDVLMELSRLVTPEKKLYSTVELAAMATFLHNCYNGIENILKRILLHAQTDVKESATWHRDLLSTALQQGVINSQLHERLAVYLSFRHFFIHAYSFTLKWDEIEPLVKDIQATVLKFRTTVDKYLIKQT